MITAIRYILIFILLLCLQLYVFDNIFVFTEARPIIFFFFILILPGMPTWLLMILAFLTGIFYDSFYYKPGVHAAACVLIAYIRDPLIMAFKDNNGVEDYSAHINYLGFSRFLFYTLIISLLFHFCVTFLSVFSFTGLLNTMARILIGTVLSVVLIYIFDIIFFYRKVLV